jgi:hypothetical protein
MNAINHRVAWLLALAIFAALSHLALYKMGLDDPEVASTCFTVDLIIGMLVLALLGGEPTTP